MAADRPRLLTLQLLLSLSRLWTGSRRLRAAGNGNNHAAPRAGKPVAFGCQSCWDEGPGATSAASTPFGAPPYPARVAQDGQSQRPRYWLSGGVRRSRRARDDSPQVDRAARYRKRAGETRSKADGMTESFSRRTMLEVAETWERLAAKELTPDAPPHNPSIVSEAHQTSVAPPTRAGEARSKPLRRSPPSIGNRCTHLFPISATQLTIKNLADAIGKLCLAYRLLHKLTPSSSRPCGEPTALRGILCHVQDG